MSDYDKCNITSCRVCVDGECRTNTKNGCGRVKAYQQGRADQREEDLHGFTEEEATQYLYELGCKDTIKLYHKYVEANLEANNFDVLINDEIRDTLLSKQVEEVLKMIEQIKEEKND